MRLDSSARPLRVFDAVDFILHRLVAVGSRADFDGRRDPRCPTCVDFFVTLFDRGEHVVPFAFNVGAVGVHLMIQFRCFQHLLALGDVRTHRDSNAHWHNAKIDNHFHLAHRSEVNLADTLLKQFKLSGPN